MSCLEILSLSETGIVQLPSFANLVSLRDLSLGGLELCSLKSLASLSSLVELDLQGVKARFSQNLQLDFLESLVNLQLLNLSETFVEKLPDISQLVNLKQLLLARCGQLKLVSDLQTLTNLEMLDLSLPQDYTMSNSQLETDSEAQSFQFLSPPSNLRKLVLAYRPGVLNLFPLASLGKLEYLDIRGTNEIDLVRAHSSKMENLEEVVGWDSHTYQRQPEERSIKADEVHVISIFYQSGFDRFITEFTQLEKLISHIQEEIKSASPDMIAKANIENQAFKRHFGSLLFDLTYLQKHINLLKTSNNSKTSEELLHELMDVATHPSAYDFSLDSTNLNLLIRLIVKLKLLFPTKLVDDLEALETTQEKKLQFTRTKCKKMVAVDNVKDPQRITDLLGSFESLTDIEKNCLLCFSIFPGSKGKNENTQFLKSGRLVIKKRMLIHWWIGEGFIHPQHDKNAEEDSAIEMLKNSRTTEEIGREILKSLEKKGFFKTVPYKGRDSGSCSMQPFVHSFMVARATEKGFFDLGQGNGELTPNFTRSRRVCLLKTEDDFPTSCRLGRSHKSASKRLQSFNTIRALLNVNESIIDIRAEWFSNLKDLFVLHLGGWGCQEGDHIEVMDQKFLEDLKCMKQLRLLSLQGFSAIKKLPDSVCKLTNLRVLNLRDCSYLEELPADIGYLKNLIHLDLTHCRILSKLPKGVRLLSKIEVLKGFVISYQGNSEHGKACLLQDLLKLEMPNKLSILVNIDKFPSTEDVMVFKEMKNLCNLKITWEKSYSEYEEPQRVAVSQKALRHSRWQKLKCWEQQTRQNDIEESPGGNHLDKLKKLVLCCFPLETIPDWFIPSNFKNLEKLYIVGGSLTSMPGTDENTWNVQILRFKYLCNLKMTFEVLEIKFPSMRYLEIYQCDKLPFLPLDDGVWTKPDTNGPSS